MDDELEKDKKIKGIDKTKLEAGKDATSEEIGQGPGNNPDEAINSLNAEAGQLTEQVVTPTDRVSRLDGIPGEIESRVGPADRRIKTIGEEANNVVKSATDGINQIRNGGIPQAADTSRVEESKAGQTVDKAWEMAKAGDPYRKRAIEERRRAQIAQRSVDLRLKEHNRDAAARDHLYVLDHRRNAREDEKYADFMENLAGRQFDEKKKKGEGAE